jgi:hypothetical protein
VTALRQRPLQVALSAAAAILALYLVALLGGAPVPPLGVVLLGSALPAAALGYLFDLGRARAPWPGRELAAAALLGLGAGLVARLADSLIPALATLQPTGLPALLGGVYVLPAALPAALLPWTGAATIGLSAAQLSRSIGGETAFLLLALLQLPLIAAPPEAWLWARGARRSVPDLAVTGALVGLGSVAAAWLFQARAFLPGEWPGLLVSGVFYGALTGWLVVRLRDRLAGRRGAGAAGSGDDPTPGR